jgi:hypothetical protein
MAVAQSLVAGMSEREPKKLPIGVLTADTITTSLIFYNVYSKPSVSSEFV